MMPVKFAEHNVVFGENQNEYMPLPAYRDNEGLVVCCWKLTWKERLWLLVLGRIWQRILVFNSPLQPQYLSVRRPFAKG